MPNSTRCQRASSTLVAVLLSCSLNVVAQTTPPASTTAPFDTLRWQAEEEIRQTQDPELGRVPYERLDQARAELAARQQSADKAGVSGVTWQERGPTNVGGSTRAVMFDLNDPSRKKAWAGSIGGGLWYTNNITTADSSWRPVSDTWENLNISALATDPSNPQVMYAGTGDGFGSYYTPNGGGIWKTTNGGTTWTRLSSTIPASPGTLLQVGFGSIMRIIVNNAGVVFAATRYGLARSTDGGSSWQFVLAPQQGIGGSPLGTSGATYLDDFTTDLEIGSDNIVYAALRNGRIFRARSLEGNSWMEITPPNTAPYTGTRAELALAPSTSGSGQVVYAITTFISSVYNADIKWFNKSVNAGDTWTSVTIPRINQSGYFTDGVGSNSLVLAVAPDNSNTVYAGGSYGYWFQSVDGAQNWSAAYSSGGRLLAMTMNSAKAVIWSSEIGPNYLTDLATLFTGSSGSYARVTNYRTTVVNAVAVQNAVNGSFALLYTDLSGNRVLASANAGPVTTNYYNSGMPYIDQDQPNISVICGGSAYAYVYDLTSGNAVYKQFPYYSSYNFASDYDSQNNVFYAYQGGLQKITDVGTANQMSR